MTNPNPVEDPAVSTESTETGPEGTTAPEGTTPPAEGLDPAALQAENFKQRDKRRAVEAERDSLAATVVRYQRAEVEKLAGAKLADPADLWLGGAKLEDQLAEDGTVDPAKVDAATDAVLADHPSWKLRPRTPAVPRNIGQGKRGGSGGGGATWTGVLTEGRRS